MTLVCPACSCVCDDIDVSLGIPCERGRAWFAPTSCGRAQPDALDRAADLLRSANFPRIRGLAGATVETARAAVELARSIGAAVETGGGFEPFLDVGRVTCSFGDLRDRADLVLRWGGDIALSHPRFAERFLRVEPITLDGNIETVWQFRDWTRHPERTPPEQRPLFDRIRACRYGVIVHGDVEPMTRAALAAWVNDLNRVTRFARVGLSSRDTTTAEAVLTWLTGWPSVEFRTGEPRPLQDSFADMELVLPGDTPDPARPTVHLHHGETSAAVVAIPVARPGRDYGGTVFRGDGIALPLVAANSPSLPTADAVIRSLIERLGPSATG